MGWGLVGLASYLLIGFWHQRPEAVAAAKKAFVMNAIGDATLALGLVLLIWQTGTLEYAGVFGQVGSLSTTMVNLSRSASSAARWRSRPRSRCTHGFPMRWRAQRRSRR